MRFYGGNNIMPVGTVRRRNVDKQVRDIDRFIAQVAADLEHIDTSVAIDYDGVDKYFQLLLYAFDRFLSSVASNELRGSTVLVAWVSDSGIPALGLNTYMVEGPRNYRHIIMVPSGVSITGRAHLLAYTKNVGVTDKEGVVALDTMPVSLHHGIRAIYLAKDRLLTLPYSSHNKYSHVLKVLDAIVLTLGHMLYGIIWKTQDTRDATPRINFAVITKREVREPKRIVNEVFAVYRASSGLSMHGQMWHMRSNAYKFLLIMNMGTKDAEGVSE
jgi:hypothetical protein